MYDINESVLVDDEAFGHIEDISVTEDFFRRLGGSSMMSMTSKSSSEDEANVISNDDAASHVAPTASIAATSAPTTKRPTILGVNPPIAAEIAVPTPSMAPMPSLPVPTMTPSSVPTPSCNLSNDERYDELQKELGVVSMSDLTNMSTPQGKACNWIVSLDEMQLCPGDDRLIQRYVVVSGDSDFRPLFTKLRQMGCQTTVMSMAMSLSGKLEPHVDEIVVLDTILQVQHC